MDLQSLTTIKIITKLYPFKKNSIFIKYHLKYFHFLYIFYANYRKKGKINKVENQSWFFQSCNSIFCRNISHCLEIADLIQWIQNQSFNPSDQFPILKVKKARSITTIPSLLTIVNLKCENDDIFLKNADNKQT